MASDSVYEAARDMNIEELDNESLLDLLLYTLKTVSYIKKRQQLISWSIFAEQRQRQLDVALQDAENIKAEILKRMSTNN